MMRNHKGCGLVLDVTNKSHNLESVLDMDRAITRHRLLQFIRSSAQRTFTTINNYFKLENFNLHCSFTRRNKGF